MAVDIKRVQDRLLYIGVSVRDILDKYDIPYTIAFGTLLGAVRHQGFIPWDDDFDLYLFDDTYDYAIEKLRNELPSDLFLEDSKSEPLYFHGWAHVKDLHSYTECDEFPQDSAYSHHGISVDLYRAKKMKKSELCDFINKENKAYIERRKSKGLISEEDYNRRIELLKSNIEKGNLYPADNSIVYSMIAMYKTKHMNEKDLFPLRDYQFENEVFKGPANADAILTSIYGDYMKLPPVDRRKTHYSKVIFN